MKTLIPLSLALCLVLTACAPANATTPAEANLETTAAQETTAPVAANTENSTRYDDSLIKEEIKTGSVKKEDGSELFTYEYHIPQILQNSEEAQALNQDLMKASPMEGELNQCQSINWESHWNGSLLSLILRFRYPSSLRYEYEVINYDCELQRPLQKQELLDRFALSDENLMEQLSFTAASYIDENNRTMEPEYQTELWDLRAQTLSRENLNRSPLFVDDTGSLTAIVTVNVPAGCGYDTPALQLKAPHSVTMTVTDSYATAKLQNGKLGITFHKDENSAWSMGEDYVPHDVSIPVDHLSGTYIDMTIGNLAREFWPVVLLLDENGHVTWVDISTYDQNSASFHGVGPVICDKSVTGFSTHNVFGNETLCGLDAEGNTVDLYTPIYQSGSCLSPNLSATSWTTEDGKYSLRIPEHNDQWNLQWFSGNEELSSGFIHFRGMDGEGIHYQWTLFNLSSTLYGSIVLRFPTADSGDMPSLVLHNFSRESLPGLPAESELVFLWEHP